MAIPQQRRATTASMPSPIGGWNARDSLAEMSPLDAVQLDNWFPTPSDVTLRKGYTRFADEIDDPVNTLMNYSNGTGQELFAVAGTKVYDVTSGTPTEVYDGLTNDKLQYVNITNSGGSFLVACNGADPVLVYDGSLWFTMATTTTAATISSIARTSPSATATVTTATAHGLATGNRVTISGSGNTTLDGTFVITVTGSTTFTYTSTGTTTVSVVVGSYTVLGIQGGTVGATTYTVNSNTFVHINLFKQRLYFTQEDTLKVWYLDTNAIGGDAYPLDFGSIAARGGYLQAMGTWTLDAGEGADDYAVFITNMGDVIVYLGTDPSDPTKWALKGVWRLGQTYTRRCFYKWSGDLLLLTQDGLVPLASALQSSRLDPRVNLTDKIYYAISQAADQFSANFGWQIIYFAKQNMLLINIPNDTGTQQYVMHTITKSWARFTDLAANCWEIHNEDLYFGSSDFVGKFWDTFADDGQNIKGSVQQAYSYFDARGQLKRFTMVRPIFLTSGGTPTVSVALNVDFETQNSAGAVSFNPALNDPGLWDTGVWDQNTWAGGLQVSKYWQGVTGLGYAGGMYMNIASQGIEVHWPSTDYVMERGGVI